MNRAFYIKRNGLFVPDRCQINPAFLGSWPKPVSGGGGGGGFTYSIIAHGVANSSANLEATLSGMNCLTANLIIIALGWAGGTPTITDDQSNTYTGLTTFTAGASSLVNTKFYHCILPTVTSSMTFQAQVLSGTGYPTIHVIAVKKSSGTPALDAHSGNTFSGSSSTRTLPSITPAGDNEMGFTMMGIGETFTATPSSVSGGYSLIDSTAAAGGVATLIQTTATAVAPLWTWSAADSAAAGAQMFWK